MCIRIVSLDCDVLLINRLYAAQPGGQPDNGAGSVQLYPHHHGSITWAWGRLPRPVPSILLAFYFQFLC